MLEDITLKSPCHPLIDNTVPLEMSLFIYLLYCINDVYLLVFAKYELLYQMFYFNILHNPNFKTITFRLICCYNKIVFVVL